MARKNILDFNGKPMLAHPIDAARKTGLFDEIYVSTEDEEISNIAKKYGAIVINRPQEIARDSSTVAEVCLHALEYVPNVTIFCCIYATAVLLRPETIIAGFELLKIDPFANFVMGVSEYGQPPVQALKTDSNGFLSYMWPEWRSVQSQSQPKLVVSNGSFYWARKEHFVQEKTFYGRNLRGCLVGNDQVSDIDTPDDLNELIELRGNIK